MLIKPLEKKTDRSALFKVLFLVTLVATGILLDKIYLKKSQKINSILGKTQEIKLQIQEKVVEVGQDLPVQENNLVKNSLNKTEELGGMFLSKATASISKLASDAGSFVSDVIYNNSIGKVVEQIDKLPKDQQERIREQICK